MTLANNRAGDGGGSVPITAMRARGKRADRGGMTALSMTHARELGGTGWLPEVLRPHDGRIDEVDKAA